MGALPSAEEWKKLRVARNMIAHEYPDASELQASAINRFFDGAAQLVALHEFVGGYVRDHFPRVGNENE